MSVTPPENTAEAIGHRATTSERIKTDKDIRAALSTVKRVIIQSFVSAVSLVVSTGIAYIVEMWLHFLEGEMETHHIPIAHFFKLVLPYITGLLLIGLSMIATILAWREAWHISGHHAENTTVETKGEARVVTTNLQPPPKQGNRAQRRRQNRH